MGMFIFGFIVGIIIGLIGISACFIATIANEDYDYYDDNNDCV